MAAKRRKRRKNKSRDNGRKSERQADGRILRVSDLKVGDRIRIIAVPGEGVPGYYIHPDTRRAYKKLIARRRSVRIARTDEYGSPWYDFRFRMKHGRWEWHTMAVMETDDNWVPVKHHRK